MSDVFSSILPIFLITLLGSIIKKQWLKSEEFWSGLEKLSYFILFPTMLFTYTASINIESMIQVQLIFGLILSTVIISIMLIFYKNYACCNNVAFTSIFQGSIRYNNYFFFGVTNALFGTTGLAIASVIALYMIIVTNILSVMVFAHCMLGQDDKNNNILDLVMLSIKLICTNPLIIASLLGFIVNYSGIKLNVGMLNTMTTLSNSALVIGMLNVGAGLQFIASKEKHIINQIMVASLAKLILLPIITAIILFIISIHDTERSVGILYSCMPCSSTSYALSRQLGGDPASMASIITFTTVFSIVSLSILMYIFG